MTHVATDPAQGDLECLVLENAVLGAEFVPACGGKLWRLTDKRSGRDWLWKNPHLPLALPDQGGDYVGKFDSGGWDEVFPSVSPCPLGNGIHVPDHGDLWMQSWKIREHSARALELATRSRALPVEIARRAELDADRPVLRFRYDFHNSSESEQRFLWAVHPLFELCAGMELKFPAGTRWHPAGPGSPSAAVQIDPKGAMVLPDPEAGFSWKGFAFTPEGSPRVTIRSSRGEGLTLNCSDGFHGIAIWINAAGWSGCGSAPYRNIGVEPCVGLGDSLADVYAGDGVTGRLAPGETRRFRLEVELS